MDAEYIFGIIISILLSANGFTLKVFITSVKDLKKVIQDLALAVRSSQKDIEYIHKELELHAKVLDKHDEDIVELKHNVKQ
jgi:short subunit dehydrogenase-like uncharacterized protein